MINKRFGKWTIVDNVESNKKNKRYLCKCDCGDVYIIMMQSLKNKTSTQCKKCYFTRSHNQSKTPTYNIWSGLFTRCYNKNHSTYKYYGAKGITVSDEWRSFDNFLRDMGERPLNFQIDRLDRTKGYEPNNCRWISKEDNTKRQNNRLIDITGMIFGKWTVLERDFTKLEQNHAYYKCVCDCGTKRSIIGSFLRKRKTKQCRDCKNKAHGKIHKGWNERIKIEKKNR